MTARRYTPIAALGTIRIPAKPAGKPRSVPVYALLLCPLIGELLAVTEAQYEVQPLVPDGFIVTHWRSGYAVDSQFAFASPAGAAIDAVHYLLEKYYGNGDLCRKFQQYPELNPIPAQIDKDWFIGARRIAEWEVIEWEKRA